MYFSETIPFTRSMAESIVHAMQENKQYTQALQFQHCMMSADIYQRQEHKQLVKEVADEVLSRLSTTVDVSKAIKQISELEKVIDSLGK